ncbi:MAG: YggS family pyridoxal phosphate-dependent enzyme [bacterium]|nr:YggS family pyridoxal phosphate-dependent enzyme [bacterium]
MSQVTDNLLRLKERIHEIALRSHRNPEEIIVVAVTKTVPIEKILEAIDAGIHNIGENRVQEAREKFNQIGNKVIWHLVGHLQTNKVKPAVAMFELIQSIDRIEVAREIDKRARQINKVQNVLIEVNTSGEETKFGIEPDRLMQLIEQILPLPNIRIQGLMTIAPLVADPERARPSFIQLRELAEQIQRQHIAGVEMRYLSMGMTNDYPVAIQEGANMLRIGTAIFGARLP